MGIIIPFLGEVATILKNRGKTYDITETMARELALIYQ
jgi:hypothetical protein